MVLKWFDELKPVHFVLVFFIGHDIINIRILFIKICIKLGDNMTMAIANHKILELIYAYNDFELKIKINIDNTMDWKSEVDAYGLCYISDKYVYVSYCDKYIRIPFDKITYIKREPLNHNVIYNEMLNKSDNHLLFYEMLMSKYNVDKNVFFECVAYTLK